MSAKCGRLNVFFVRVNCSIWDPPNPPRENLTSSDIMGGPTQGSEDQERGVGGGGGKMENRFFIGNVFLSF